MIVKSQLPTWPSVLTVRRAPRCNHHTTCISSVDTYRIESTVGTKNGDCFTFFQLQLVTVGMCESTWVCGDLLSGDALSIVDTHEDGLILGNAFGILQEEVQDTTGMSAPSGRERKSLTCHDRYRAKDQAPIELSALARTLEMVLCSVLGGETFYLHLNLYSRAGVGM